METRHINETSEKYVIIKELEIKQAIWDSESTTSVKKISLLEKDNEKSHQAETTLYAPVGISRPTLQII